MSGDYLQFGEIDKNSTKKRVYNEWKELYNQEKCQKESRHYKFQRIQVLSMEESRKCFKGELILEKKISGRIQNLTEWDLSHIRREVIRNPNASSAFMFQAAGAPMMSRETRCKAMEQFADIKNQSRYLFWQ